MAEALKAVYGEEAVSLVLVGSRIHADDRLYTDEVLGAIDSYLRGGQM